MPYNLNRFSPVSYTHLDVYKRQRSTVKKPGDWHFKFSTYKRFILTRGKLGSGLVREEVAYKCDGRGSRTISKKGCPLASIRPETKPNSFPLDPNKVTDVKKLLAKHYGENWNLLETLKYYVELFNDIHVEHSVHNQELMLMKMNP